jgi:hypothetical protein
MNELSKMSTLEKINFYDALCKDARKHELNTRRRIRQEDAKDAIHMYWFTTKSQLEAKADKYAAIALRIRTRLYVLTNIYLLNL